MKLPILHSLLATCLIAISGTTLAQDVSTEPNDENYTGSSKRSMRVIAFYNGELENEPEALFYEHKGKKMRLNIGIGSLSSSMPKPAGEVMKIYQQVELPKNNSRQAKFSYRHVGTVPMVSSSKLIVLLVVPEDLSKDKIRAKSFKDSKSIHPKETARVFNMSTKVIAIRAGKEAKKIPVGGNDIIKWKAMAFNSVSYQVATEGKKAGTWDIIESSECAAHPDMRTFVFVSGSMIENRQTVTSSTFLDPVPDKDGDTP